MTSLRRYVSLVLVFLVAALQCGLSTLAQPCAGVTQPRACCLAMKMGQGVCPCCRSGAAASGSKQTGAKQSGVSCHCWSHQTAVTRIATDPFHPAVITHSRVITLLSTSLRPIAPARAQPFMLFAPPHTPPRQA